MVVTLGSSIDEATLLRARSLGAALAREAGVVEVVPAYTTVTVFYDNALHPPGEASPYERVCRLIAARAEKTEHSWPDIVRENLGARRDEAAHIEIPVCYGGEFGPDLETVAGQAKLEAQEVVELHSSASYVVHAVGFTPGFPYLGGLPARLRMPRRATPRTIVPAGSVGIGGEQTGVYPIATPGGWQLIGRTPLALFRAMENPPALLRVGDHVRFAAITPEEFAAWK